MGTYDHKKLLSDYTNGRMDMKMAMAHTLQHIDKLYEVQVAANVSRYDLRSKVDTLENTVNTLQAKIARLTALIEKFLPKRKGKSSGKPQKD